MNTTKTLKQIESVRKITESHMVGDGLPVRQVFSPRGADNTFSPFIMLDYIGPAKFPPMEKQKGVDEHPHRGFETVTLVFQGVLEHRDSAGNAGRIEAGDVQWMTAASGVVHEEKHGKELMRNGGVLEAAQLWVNLPAKDKMGKPKYQALTAASIPTVPLENGALRIVAGRYRDAHGPAATHTELNVWDLRIRPGVSELEIPESHTTLVVVVEGETLVNDSERVSGLELVQFGRSGGAIRVEASTEAHLLVLTGVPIDEPVVSYGPFVMNSQAEIHAAIRDYQEGKMGRLDDSAN
ncbi:MAG: pirin family protein [Deltaproteobacteria bacterium]|nr:pirin family protein [Deltaproteobacteria bacterium]